MVIADFLKECRLGHKQDILVPHLEGLGVTCLEDLIDVEREDMKGVGKTLRLYNNPFEPNVQYLLLPIMNVRSYMVVDHQSLTLLLPIPQD